MKIYYALVGKDEDNVILADYTEFAGNFKKIVADLMPRLSRNSMKTLQDG